MRIGIDGLPLNQQLTGVGHYTLELARALAKWCPKDQIEMVSPRPYLFGTDGIESGDSMPPNLSFIRAPSNFITRRWWTIGLPRYLAKNSFELFHGTNFEVPIWLTQKIPTVLTVHDLSLLLHPATHSPRLVRRARRMIPLMTRAATMVVTPTESVKSEIVKTLRIPDERIVAIPEAAREIFQPMPRAKAAATRKRLGIGENFLLFVGTLEPRKDLTTLLRAFEEIARTQEDGLQLVIAGRHGWLVDDLLSQIKSSASDRILLTGYLSDDDLRALYSTCLAFVYPSTYEGFGLPPLEAMACGAPVITTSIDSLNEVCGNASLSFAPKSVAGLTRALKDVINNKKVRLELSEAGRRRAAQFSWERTAKLTLKVYHEAISRFADKKRTKQKAGSN